MQSQTIRGDTSQKPDGGFVEIPTFVIGLLWWAYTHGLITLRAVRVGLALFELRIRRQAYVWTEKKHHGRIPDFVPRFTVGELADLVGLPKKKARAALAELLALGIVIEFSATQIGFPRSPDAVNFSAEQKPAFEAWLSTFTRRKRVPIPRRALTLLVESSFPAQIATILGVCLRCSWYYPQEGRYLGTGRVSCTWISETFAVCLRAVKRARKSLVSRLGWLESRGKINRFGEVVAINLAWERLAGLAELKAENPQGTRVGGDGHLGPETVLLGGPQNAPPPPPTGPQNAPALKRESPPDGINPRRESRADDRPDPECPDAVTEPRANDGPGVFISHLKGEKSQDTPRNSAEASRPGPGISASTPREKPRPEALPAPPRLSDIRPEDFRDVGRALELFRQAVQCGLMPNASEHSRLLWMAALERARTVPAKNPAGLFLYLVKGRKWDYLSEGHFEAANRRLKGFLYGGPPPAGSVPLLVSRLAPAVPPSTPEPRLSRDALLMKTIREGLARRGLDVSLFATLRSHADFTPERYRAALAELEQVPRKSPSLAANIR